MQISLFRLILVMVLVTSNFLSASAEDYPRKILNLGVSSSLKTKDLNSAEEQEYKRLERDFLKTKKTGGKIASLDLVGRWSVTNQLTGNNFYLDILDISTEKNISSFTYRIVDDNFTVSSGIGIGIGTILVFTFTYVDGNETYFLQINKSARGFNGTGAFTVYIPSTCIDDNEDGNYDVGELYYCVTLDEPLVGFGGVNMVKVF